MDLAHVKDLSDIARDAIVSGAAIAALKNVGKVEIEAIKSKAGEVAYRDKDEKLVHACTLQLKRLQLPAQLQSRCIDWFGHNAIEPVRGLEDIDLLFDYEDPERHAADFWMEPGETYALSKTLVLQPGVYLGKVTFIGSKLVSNFWTRVVQFTIPTK